MERISRTREEILDGMTVGSDGKVWVPCHHCGGSGNYPSSMTPSGRCRLYCWENRNKETFGKLPVSIDKYVRRQQAADRRAHHTKVGKERQEKELEGLKREALGKFEKADARLRRAVELSGISVEEAVSGNVPGFISSLLTQYLYYGRLTDRQWEALESYTKEEERKDAFGHTKKMPPEGRHVVEGKIIKLVWKENYPYGETLKMTVECEDYNLFGTVPSSLLPEGEKLRGHNVRFRATISPKETGFGFFSRPTSAILDNSSSE